MSEQETYMCLKCNSLITSTKKPICSCGSEKTIKIFEEPFERHLEILQDPDVFERICSEFGKQIVGEEESCKVIFHSACGRLVENSQTASFNLLVNDDAGAGKDYVVSKVLSIIPKETLPDR